MPPMPPMPPTPAPDPGADRLVARRVADRYRLLQVVGRGGMGTVWRAYDELLGREVAVKELRQPPGTSDADARTLAERTLREARAAGRLANPHVVTVYDAVVDDSRPWIVMELLRARSLAAVVEEDGPLPPDRVARIGLQVLSALEDAHRHGMLHRDVKPGNVMLGAGDWVTLTDFGLVTSAGDPHLTAAGVVLGSPDYVAPERIRGNAEPGPPSDLWSLGATLYAAVEGRAPFHRDGGLETVSAVLNDKPLAMRNAGPLKGLLSGLLKKDPDSRIDAADARELLQRAALRGVPPGGAAPLPRAAPKATPTDTTPPPAPEPRTPPVPEPAPPWVPRPRAQPEGTRRPTPRRRTVVLVALLASLVAVVVGFVATRASEDSAAPTTAPSQPPAAPEAPEAPQTYQIYTHPVGYTLAVPVGWVSSGPDEAATLTDPTGTTVLRVETAPADPAGSLAALQQEHDLASAGTAGYELIALEQVDYRSYDAAEWDRTEDSDAGQRRIRSRAFTDPARPGEPEQYVVTLETPAESWQLLEPVFTAAMQTFQTPRA